MKSVKESVANAGASAKAGVEKTKATVQEKVSSSSPPQIFIYAFKQVARNII